MFPYKKATIGCGFAFANNIKSLDLNFIPGCFLVGAGFMGHGGPVIQAFKNKLCVPQRHLFHFEQAPFQSMHTLLR